MLIRIEALKRYLHFDLTLGKLTEPDRSDGPPAHNDSPLNEYAPSLGFRLKGFDEGFATEVTCQTRTSLTTPAASQRDSALTDSPIA